MFLVAINQTYDNNNIMLRIGLRQNFNTCIPKIGSTYLDFMSIYKKY